MTSVSPAHIAIWLTAAAAVMGVIVRPGNLPEAVWAVLGASILACFALISPSEVGAAILKGTDVYLFLIGMMLLAEVARREGLFEWLAVYAVRLSKGSAGRMFTLIYVVGVVVTVLLSNDATAVVLTPAVYVVTKRAGVEPLPYLLICAFVANAASFVLPISNPANLVVYGARLPPLLAWLQEFGVASLVGITATYFLLRVMLRKDLTATIEADVDTPALTMGGRLAAAGVAITAILLLLASSLDLPLGLPTFAAGALTAAVILVHQRARPWPLLEAMSWSVLPLVAGLFVLVQGVESTGVLAALTKLLLTAAQAAPQSTALWSGVIAGLACNAVNNLPLGLLAGAIASGGHLTPRLSGTLLIGVDMGPNLSVTGSLATILWLTALRRDGQSVSAWQFLRIGCIVMPTALIAALVSFIWMADFESP